MRILYVTSSGSSSGGSRQALYLVSGMAAHGHSVTFLTPPDSTLRHLDIAKNVDFVDLPDSCFEWNSVLEPLIEEPTIVHAFHNKAVKVISVLGTWWRLTGRQIACVAHRGVIYPPRNPLPYLLPGIQCFAVNSKVCLNTLPLFWRKKKGMVVYNGIPDSKITPNRDKQAVLNELTIPSDSFVIGCVSNNTHVKGIDVLIDAYARANLPNTHLVLVGDNGEKWLPLCAEKGISDQVRVVPATEQVADYLQVFTLFVLPSRSESSPNTLLEAMCLGLPALASNVGGVPECINDKRFLFSPDNSDELATKLAFCVDNSGLLDNIGKDNKEFAQRFSLSTKLNTMEKIYTDLLQRS